MRLYSQSSTCVQTIGDGNGGAHAPPRLEAGRGGHGGGHVHF